MEGGNVSKLAGGKGMISQDIILPHPKCDNMLLLT